MKPEEKTIVSQLFIFFFFYSKIAFSQLVKWRKYLQQNVYSKESTRKAPRTERAKHFHKPNSGHSLRRRPDTSHPQESATSICSHLVAKGGTGSHGSPGAALIAAPGRPLCASL